jgi:protein-S-isoprenylcysteine O-methyltransferase Ste14
MSHPSPSADRIERLQRRRTRLTIVQSVLFLAWQVNFFALDKNPGPHSANTVKISAYIVWAALLLAFLATGGNWWSGRETRAILNDEVTRAHRHQAMTTGFYAAMGAALGSYVVSLFDALDGREVVHIVLTVGIGSALLTFGLLERRAQADG